MAVSTTGRPSRRSYEEEQGTADRSNTLKYISLFPKEADEKKSKGDDEDKEKLKLPKHLEAELSDDLEQSVRTRLTMLLETRRLMDEGKLSTTPETERGEHVRVEIAIEEKAGKRKAAVKEAAKEEDDFFDSD